MTDTFFFYASKIGWSLVSPDSLLLFMLLIGLISLLRKHYSSACFWLGVPITCLLLLAFVPLGNLLMYPLESRFAANPVLPDRVDGIIVLGGSIKALESYSWNQVELSESSERNVAFLDLAQRYPSAQLLMTGGTGSLFAQEYREADVAQDLFELLGIDPGRITFERESRNTWENVRNSIALVDPQPGENWILITSAYHMPRSVGLFCNQGWPVLPWPVDHQTTPSTLWQIELRLATNLNTLVTAVREWAGLVVYYASGRISSLQTDGCLPLE